MSHSGWMILNLSKIMDCEWYWVPILRKISGLAKEASSMCATLYFNSQSWMADQNTIDWVDIVIQRSFYTIHRSFHWMHTILATNERLPWQLSLQLSILSIIFHLSSPFLSQGSNDSHLVRWKMTIHWIIPVYKWYCLICSIILDDENEKRPSVPITALSSHRNVPASALQYPGFSPMNRDILCKWTIVWWNSAQGLILKLVDSTRSDSSTSHEEK